MMSLPGDDYHSNHLGEAGGAAAPRPGKRREWRADAEGTNAKSGRKGGGDKSTV
jgi:hypothetical protein